jgi:hypothetical protein
MLVSDTKYETVRHTFVTFIGLYGIIVQQLIDWVVIAKHGEGKIIWLSGEHLRTGFWSTEYGLKNSRNSMVLFF